MNYITQFLNAQDVRKEQRLRKELLKKAAEQKVPSPYLNEDFPSWQLETIIQRHADQKDISMYDEPCLDWMDKEIVNSMAAVADYKQQISVSAAEAYDDLAELSTDLKNYYCGSSNDMKEQARIFNKLADVEREYCLTIDQLNPSSHSGDLNCYQLSLWELRDSLREQEKEYLPDHAQRYHQTDGYKKNPVEYEEFVRQQLQLYNRAIELICEKYTPLVYSHLSPEERVRVQKGESYQSRIKKKSCYTAKKKGVVSNKVKPKNRIGNMVRAGR